MHLLEGVAIVVVLIAGAAVLVGVAFLTGWKVLERKVEIAGDTPLRTENHEAQVRALIEWLTDLKIARTIVDQRIATADGLASVLEQVEFMDEGEVAATVALILRDRTVRRVISHYEAKAKDLNRAEVMECLAMWAEPVRKEVMAS